LEARAQREVVVLVPCEARQVEHDHELDAALIQPAEREQVLKLAAVGRFGAFAFLVEAFEDFVSLAAAVLLARAKLRRQAQVLGLLLRLPAEARSSRGACNGD
jgi:hypothetical protein